jgi:hypothetical protein
MVPLHSLDCFCTAVCFQCVTDDCLGSFPLGQNNIHAHVEMGMFVHVWKIYYSLMPDKVLLCT